MAVVNQLNLNVGTEQNPNFVLHDINDKRISTTNVTTATHLLACNSGVTSIAPITAANLASVLGAFIKGETFDIDDIHTTITFICHSRYLDGTLPSGHTTSAFATIETFAGNDAIQAQRLTYYGSSSTSIYTRLWRDSTTWGTWQQV